MDLFSRVLGRVEEVVVGLDEDCSQEDREK